MQVSMEDCRLFARLTDLCDELYNLDRSYDLMEVAGKENDWRQQRNATEKKFDELTESLTLEQKQLFYSRNWTYCNAKPKQRPVNSLEENQ